MSSPELQHGMEAGMEYAPPAACGVRCPGLLILKLTATIAAGRSNNKWSRLMHKQTSLICRPYYWPLRYKKGFCQSCLLSRVINRNLTSLFHVMSSPKNGFVSGSECASLEKYLIWSNELLKTRCKQEEDLVATLYRHWPDSDYYCSMYAPLFKGIKTNSSLSIFYFLI